MTLDLTDDEAQALAKHRQAIDDHRFPLAPRLALLKPNHCRRCRRVAGRASGAGIASP
jgi:hypothetical protein